MIQKTPIANLYTLTGRQKWSYAGICVLGGISALLIGRGYGAEELLGGFLTSTILYAVFYRDVRRYKPAYLEKTRMLCLLGFMILFTLAISRGSWYASLAFMRGMEWEASRAAIFGLPVPAGVMLVALLFDFHTAMIFTVVMSLLTGLWMNDPAVGLYVFVGSLTAAFSVIRCKRRTAILKGGAYLLGVNLLVLPPLQLFTGDFLSLTTLSAVAFAIYSPILVVAVVSLLLPVLESVFKVTTDISLLELLDLDQPLMKSLMVQAPGTYHHSIIVGNLVDSVADSVGVNPLLARVGAYYHDIGKVKMPEYFIENQSWGASKHDKLTPHMSSMILTSHVKEGVELAVQHKLPESLIAIIEQHHGNALITYFYEKAKDRPYTGELKEADYRYPGPRPQTRVAALIMMADAVEAASRVLTDPTPARIAALVDRIINHIFLSGQLDECELTFKDINMVKDRFTRILTGILHKRINYPGFDFDKEKKKDGNGNGKQQAEADRAQSTGHGDPGDYGP